MARSEGSAAMEVLLEANGIPADQFSTAASTVTHLEMFLHHYPRMEGLQHFPALKSLALMHQELKEIRNLDGCPLLEKLWLQENEISVIQGLDNLPRLKELYLYSNHITEIRGLSRLTQLEVLWLSDNYISRIGGLEGLPLLRELHLARNDIVFVGDGLAGCAALTHLNLADNRIGSFKELRPLAALPRLVDLCFSDPMWGDCPLAQLCNYQTFVLFMLPRLTCLDTLLLAEETKALAEATFLKKQMYYNMRIKTLRRNARQIIKLAAEGRQARDALRQPLKNTLVLAAKDAERTMEDARRRSSGAGADGGGGEGADGADSDPESGDEAAGGRAGSGMGAGKVPAGSAPALRAKLEAVQGRLAKYQAAEVEADAQFEAASEQVYGLLGGLVSRMMLELDTAGNIRLEEGRATDLWYASCSDLVNSRFTAADFPASLGVSGLTITGVTRIYNRWLRTRFDAALSGATNTSDPSHKRALEYLFLGEHPALPGLLDVAVEEGLPEVEHLAEQGLDPAVVLASTLFLAERLRLAAAVDPAGPAGHGASSGGAGGGGAGGGGGSGRARGRIMIVKAYLGRTQQDMSVSVSGGLPSKLYGKDGKPTPGSLLEGGARLNPAAWPDTDAVYRAKPGDMKQRLWYVFNNVLVLPEYIVDFTYDVSPASPLAAPRTHGSVPQPAAAKAASASGGGAAVPSPGGVDPAVAGPTFQAILDSLDADIRPLARPMLGWLALQADPTLLRLGLAAEEEDVTRLVSSPPQLPQPAKLYRLSDEVLSKAVSGSPLHSITRLDLHNSGLRKIEALNGMRQLQVLVLCYNELTRLEGLEGLVHLHTLDLGHNSIRKVESHLKGLTALTHLDLSSNQVLKLEELYNMKKYSPQLVVLDLRDNPICTDKAYRSTALRKLKHMERFDGRAVSAEEKERFGEQAGAVTVAMMLEHGSVASRGHVGLAADGGHPSDPALITDLTLERMHIRRLQQLTSLVSLRRANLADNEISSLEGIESCRALEELSLEANRVSSLVGLGQLTRLRKLQLGQNRLASLESLSGLVGLVQLSVEDNELGGLAGVDRLTNLMELYAGNNRISELREIQRLRELPKLIILDLAGNPLAGSLAAAAAAAAAGAAAAGAPGVPPPVVVDDYRLYVIFNVRKLKVLDGVAVTAAEQAAAKNRYAGRLTADFLEERLGHRLFDRIRDLDCSGLKIRDVGSVFLSEDMEGLQELNLDNNLITEVSGMALLRNLSVLRLNGNRLGEECSFAPQRMLERNPDLARALAARQQRLEPFPSLQVLTLGGNQISSIPGLQLGLLNGLRSLFLQGNDITRIEGLEGLVNLQELVLDRNRIRYIDSDALGGLPRLRELRLEENGLRSLGGLGGLARSLQALHVGSNRIAEAVDLDRLASLPGLLEVTLAGNPVARKQAYRAMLLARCPRLQVADGQPLSQEERDYAEQMFNPTAAALGMGGMGGMGMPPGPMGMVGPGGMAPGQLMPPGAMPGSADAIMAAMAAASLGGGAGGAAVGSKQPIKMTNMDFGLSGAPIGVASAAGAANSVPSIQAATVVLTGPASFGLEGVGFGAGGGGGGMGAMPGAGPAGGWPGMGQVGGRGMSSPGMRGGPGGGMGRGSPAAGASPLRKGQGVPSGRGPYK